MNWPYDASAAISLTYDDGLPDNLGRAIPDLNTHNLRGTFYLTTGKPNVRRRADSWRRAFERGHEIGSHTVQHPCRADAYPKPPRWLPPGLRLENWSAEDIEREVDEAAAWLNKYVGVDLGRTFAYPCGATAIGSPPDELSYDKAVRRHHFAARAGTGGPNDPRTVNLMRIRSFICDHPTLSELVSYCNQALETGSWTVLMFHSIGGRRLRTRRSVHEKLLDYLKGRSYWVAPVRDVAAFIDRDRERPES
jgi:peptidoglycan/xylan/chitin deacetylase (PgdA/CDA1 family)